MLALCKLYKYVTNTFISICLFLIRPFLQFVILFSRNVERYIIWNTLSLHAQFCRYFSSRSFSSSFRWGFQHRRPFIPCRNEESRFSTATALMENGICWLFNHFMQLDSCERKSEKKRKRC